MEQVGHWTWAAAESKRKCELSSHPVLVPAATATSLGDSWEEQAFAEDTSGLLGGCIWPPRSYNCSFCRREFRSAQALGGHMNVHRRDRARLRQFPVPQTYELVLNPCQSFEFHEYPSQSDQIYTLSHKSAYSDSDPVRASNQNQKVSSKKRVSSHGSISPIIQERHRKNMVSLSLPSSSRKKPKVSESSKRAKEDYLALDLSESLNPTRTNASSDEEVASCKRRKIDANPLDLELRLGVK